MNNNSVVTVSHSAFSGNSDRGIANYDGMVTVSHSTFSGNSAAAGGSGGAITTGWDSVVTVSHSAFSGNSADGGGAIAGDDDSERKQQHLLRQ